MKKVLKYNLIVPHGVCVITETFSVSHRCVSLMVELHVMHLVIHTITHLIDITLTFKEAVNMFSLSHVTLQNSLSLFLMVHTILMCPALIL